MAEPPIILIIEDNLDVREVIVNCLTMEGYRTLVATGLHVATQLLQTQHIDLILLDLMLREKSGIEIVEDLAPLTDAPIISMSASDLLLAESRLWDEFADFVSKPFSISDLIACVERNLPNREASHGG